VLAAPRGAADTDVAALVARVAAAFRGPGFAPVRLLPSRIDVADLPPGGSGIPLGVDEERLARVELDPIAEPHLVCFADAESGKTTLLRLIAQGIVGRCAPDQARMIVVDPRRGLLGAVPESHLIGYASTAEQTAAAARALAESLRKRLPGPEVTPRALRERSWWQGPEVYLLVDDYDLVATGPVNPLAPLLEFLAQGRDIGLHLVVTRRVGGASRAMFDPIISRIRDLASPGMVMSGPRDEGALIGTVRPQALPPGRGWLVTRRAGARLVQLAWLPPA
jgi:S-DNA-T family DNA segregation ATPase FtsK/SpoIIIE